MAVLRQDVAYVGGNGMLTKAGYDLFIGLFRDQADTAARLSAAEGKIAAAAAIANASGGATVDTQARAQLAAIRSALS
jgi:hypothetical protein